MKSKFAHPSLAAVRRRALLVALAMLACAVVGGCVHRRFTVRTNPPGARLFVDDYEIGTTPVSHDFVYYGTRKIRLVKDGYDTLTILQPMPSPWYDWPGIDFFTENLIPYEFNDHRVLDYQMQPQVIVPTEQLLTRADELRRTKNPAVPAGSAPVGGPPPVGAPPSGASPGGLPPGMSPPGAWQPSAGPAVGPPASTVPQYVTPPGGAPQYGAPQFSSPPATQGPSTFQPSPPSGVTTPGAPGAGVPSLPNSQPVWPTGPPSSTTVPPATGGPPATSGPSSNYPPPRN